MAIDLTTPTGRVRLMIPDREETSFIFSDAEIEAFLAIEDASLKRATALALETIATDEALVQKVQKQQHIETNGAATAKVLLDRANKLREQAAPAAEDDADPDGQFEIVEVIKNQFSAREHRRNQRWTDGW